MSTSEIEWVAQVSCEYGGPAIIADVADYQKWMGSTQYPMERRTTLHYWGQFTSELPGDYAQEGGHVSRKCQDLPSLRKERDALIAAVEAKFSGATATVDDEAGEAHILLPDGRQMSIEFAPKSQYEEACAGEGEIWPHSFASKTGDGHGLFWDKQGSGDFFVGVSKTHDELILLRTWVDHDSFDATAQAAVATRHRDEQDAQGLHLVVSEGPVVVAYSPYSWLTMLGEARANALASELSDRPQQSHAHMQAAYRALVTGGKDTRMLASDEDQEVAAVVTLTPGKYSTSYGNFEPEDNGNSDGNWSCIWCRFTLHR